MIKRNTFSFKLNLFIVPIVSVLIIFIITAFYIISHNLLLNTIEENAKNIAEKNINKIDAVISKSSKIPFNVALVLETIKFNGKDDLLDLLKKIVKNNNEIYGAAIAFEPFGFKKDLYRFSPYVYKKNDKILTTNLDSEEYNYLCKDWYLIPKRLNAPWWSEPYFDEGGGNILMTTYSVPFYKIVNGVKKFRGIITIDISLSWLDDLVSGIKIFDKGFAFVISQTGTLVTFPQKNFILNHTIFSLAEEFNFPANREIGRKMIAGKSGFEKINGILFPEASKIFYTPLNSNKWSLAVIYPETELYSSLNNLSLMIIAIAVAGIILLIYLITYISKKLTKPLSFFSEIAKKIGSGNFEVKLPEINSKDEIKILHDSFKKMQLELNNYIEDLKITTSEKEKIESELRIAHQIQMGMIPKIFPPFPDRSDLDLHAFLEPAKEVGGDLYDFFFVDESKLIFTVGDVAGKGVPASLFMAVTRTLIRSKIIKGTSIAKVVDEINHDLIENNESNLFVTLLICSIDLKTGLVEYVNAGHNYPFVVSDNTVSPLKDKHGMALGLYETKPYTSSKFFLKKDEKFILYTDGINEAMNAEGEQYDYKRFQECLSKIGKLSSREATAFILKGIKSFTKNAEQSDDMTLLIISLLTNT